MRGARPMLSLTHAFAATLALCLGYAGAAYAFSAGEPASAPATSVGEWMVCAVLSLPLLLYVHICEALGVLATKRALGALGRSRPEFGWKRLEADANAVIRALY